MSYSLEKHPNAPYEFPPPPPFLVWVQGYVWDHRTRTRKQVAEGQVRHVADLTKAKKRVSSYAKPWRHEPGTDTTKFAADWAIYLWNKDQGEYVLQYDGKAGESIELNALFAARITKAQKHTPRPGFDTEVEAALASIAQAVKA